MITLHKRNNPLKSNNFLSTFKNSYNTLDTKFNNYFEYLKLRKEILFLTLKLKVELLLTGHGTTIDQVAKDSCSVFESWFDKDVRSCNDELLVACRKSSTKEELDIIREEHSAYKSLYLYFHGIIKDFNRLERLQNKLHEYKNKMV